MPAFTTDMIKCSIQFSRSGGEQAETGFWWAILSAAGGYTQAQLDTWTLAVYNAFITGWTGTFKALSASSLKPLHAKSAVYLAGDLHSDLVSIQGAESTAGTGSFEHPDQVAVVCSLRSPIPTRSGRGRMYLPFNSVAMDGLGQYNGANTAQIGGAMKTFLDAVNALQINGQDGDVVVASKTQGVARKVTTIITNSVPDIQRRRANKLIPTTIDQRALA